MSKWDYELPELRAKIGSLTAENEALRHDLKEMTSAYYGVINRLKDATSGISSEPLSELEEKGWEAHYKRIMKE